ncbi:putative DNA-binding domain-containing protein [Sedimentitalea sp. HM32M-2]|uniref:HvfC/BufC family peptide modification chaperone n=1 Tax=Sedimentitalea sp. HM32M-2 TaxID=3351566 RepID=UPI003624F64E
MKVSQDLFAAALMDPARPAPAGLVDGRKQAAQARFDVYRNNVTVSLTEALQTGFPILTKLLGRQNMATLARQFLRAHPPRSPLLMHYGQALPDYLAGLPQLAHLGYLPDVARLELALRRSYHAADSRAIAPDCLASTAPDVLMRSTVTLAPALQVLRSDWPLFDIWRFNTQPDAPKPAHVAQDVVITRPEFDPEPHLLPPGGAALIAALGAGSTLTAALDDAQAKAADFDLTATLSLLLAGQALTSLQTKD